MEFHWNFSISQNWGCGGQGCYFWPNPRVVSKKYTFFSVENIDKLAFVLSRTLNVLQVNLCQKLLFLHQLTHNMTTDLFIELQVQYMKITSSNASNLGRTFRTIFVHNMFSPCSAKTRASDKDLPVRIV